MRTRVDLESPCCADQYIFASLKLWFSFRNKWYINLQKLHVAHEVSFASEDVSWGAQRFFRASYLNLITFLQNVKMYIISKTPLPLQPRIQRIATLFICLWKRHLIWIIFYFL